jgi:molybdenum-dependent DNA-binding transcriptional regulator ModE|tara:strand:+ start:12791 stop:12967 length:177 start_codon:yes stop_codon:yes gene_type:complete
MNEENKELLNKAEEISSGLKRLSKKSRKVVMPYHSSYDLIEELEEVAENLVNELKSKI